MESNLEKKEATRKTGTEPFRNGKEKLPFDLLSFWRWSASDLLSNATRGILAEYIVANALGIGKEGFRDEWAAYDLLMSNGTKVEVKSAAYLQSWYQSKFSIISFHIPKTHAWDSETNIQSDVAKHQADVYVFAVLAHKDKSTVDPLDLMQWQFFVLPTCVLDQRSQHSITLPTLKCLAGGDVKYSGLAEAVRTASMENKKTTSR